jgi:LacI family transcriptional regulator
LYRHSIRVPQDVSLVGFDDLLTSLHVIPPLTTVHQPAYEQGRVAAAAMLQLLAGGKPKLELPAPRLIERESSSLVRP